MPQLLPTQDAARATAGLRGLGALLRLPLYRRVILVAALIIGSHAMHDSFAVIRWGAAGIGPGTAGLLWSLSVAAEVMVFLFVGRPLLDRLGPAGAAMLAAAAGIVRWAVMAETAWLPALAAIEPLHGLTFALLHLTCMRLLVGCVPRSAPRRCPSLGRCASLLANQPDLPVNGARNFPNYGEVKFPSLAGGVISRPVDQGLRFSAAVHDV